MVVKRVEEDRDVIVRHDVLAAGEVTADLAGFVVVADEDDVESGSGVGRPDFSALGSGFAVLGGCLNEARDVNELIFQLRNRLHGEKVSKAERLVNEGNVLSRDSRREGLGRPGGIGEPWGEGQDGQTKQSTRSRNPHKVMVRNGAGVRSPAGLETRQGEAGLRRRGGLKSLGERLTYNCAVISDMRTSRRKFLFTGTGAALGAAAAGVAAGASTGSGGETGRAGCREGKALPRIVVHEDGHMLAGADGSAFFWLGDTAWQLIQELSRDECSYYLETRARQGFTVIQTVVLAEFGGVRQATTTGFLPFADGDVKRPNEDFFDRVTEIVDEAARHGLYVALVPAWGDKLTAPWGAGPRLFRNDNPGDAEQYGAYLAGKLKGRSNVLWVLGGDRPARLAGLNADDVARISKETGIEPDQDWTPIWRAMAAGLKRGGGGWATIAYHPQGGRQSSSFFLEGEGWLSINGMQSGHGGGHDVAVWEMIAHDYGLRPAKPTLDLEPNYEDHPYNPWPEWDPATGYFRDHDVRKQVYRSVFAGGCGVTYGHHAVWQFAGKRHEVVNHADRDWKDALWRPAARQMMFLRALVESRPYFRRIPDQGLIVGNAGEGGQHMQATRDREGTYAFVYFPANDLKATVDLSRLKARQLRGWWYDPRTGIGTPIEEMLTGKAQEFRSPSFGPDWVLVVEDGEAGYGPPGLGSGVKG